MSVDTDKNGAKTNQKEPEGSPRQLFKKMELDNYKQNKRLTKKFSTDETSNEINGTQDRGPKMGIRFLVCTLGTISLAMSVMSRMVLNLSITKMVDNHHKSNGEVPTDGSCPWPEYTNLEEDTIMCSAVSPPTTDYPMETTVFTTLEPSTTEPSSVVEHTTLQHEEEPIVLDNCNNTGINSTNHNASRIHHDGGVHVDRFNWTMKQQGVLLGGFYYSYFVFMILGGRMSEIYGAKYIILLCVGGSSIINLATPWMARNSFGLLVFSRIIMGSIQSGVFPAMYALIARWLTMSEASIFAPMVKMMLRLGMFFASLILGMLPGWPEVFYFTGTCGIIWSVLWIFIATSDPQDNTWVSKAELAHIMKKKRKFRAVEEVTGGDKLKDLSSTNDNGDSVTAQEESAKKETTQKTPWIKIITAPSVLGLIIVKLTFNYGVDFLAIELPTYLNNVHHATSHQISRITSAMFSIQVFLIIFIGWLAKEMVKRRPLGMSKTTTRKLFQSIASYGVAIVLFLITFNDCNLVYVGVLLQLVSFLSVFTAGGETMLPYDLSDEYPATIMAIANSVANLSGVTTTVLVSFVLGDQGGSYTRWNIIIYLVAGVNFLGATAFLFLVKAKPIDFTSSKKRQEDLERAQVNNDGIKTIKMNKLPDIDDQWKPNIPNLPRLSPISDIEVQK